MLSALAAAPAGHHVLAVLENASTDRYIDALKMQADGVADADREPQDIVAELTHVLAGTPRIPYPALRRAVAHAPVTHPFVPAEEVQLLRWLIEGLTVEEMKLRRVEGKRQTERQLQGLLRRFHATNRYAALIQAERWGLLDDVVTPGTDQPEPR